MTTDVKFDQRTVAMTVGMKRSPARTTFKHALLIAVGLVMLYPLIWMLGASFKEGEDIFSEVSPIPNPFTLENYARGWEGAGVGFGTFILNSTIVALLSV